ncbi:MAG: glycoside hydrolase family 2 protein [Acidimicrobiia bacterium]
MELSGTWRAAIADEELRRVAFDHDHDDSTWDLVNVPGHWQLHPSLADNNSPVLYRTRFEHRPPSEGERWWLTLDGVCYQGDVWLDGAYVGDTEGYFFPHSFEVTDALAARGDHTLAVEVTCAPTKDPKAKRNITGSLQHSDTIDPSWNPGGLWRPVRLERSGPVRIGRLRAVCSEADSARAVVALRAELLVDQPVQATVRTRLDRHTEKVTEHPLAAGSNRVEWTMVVDQPQLWWPWSLGEQILQQLEVSVEINGVVSDMRTVRIGLRQVSMRNWIFTVNGERLFLKGVQLGPTSLDLANVSAASLRRDVQLAREAGLDMIRVHAHVSRSELYDAADELGMLVWQDFPLQWRYARTIRKQATRQARELVDLLGHHPSIALWCGHDAPVPVDGLPDPDVHVATLTTRYALGQQLPTWNKTRLDASVKRALDRADQSRPVIAHSGVLPHFPQLDGTDSHLWFGWYHGDERDLSGALRMMPRLGRFVTGFGSQSIPPSTDFIDASQWPELNWDELEAHHGLQRALLERRVPTQGHPDFASWAEATRAYQAEVVRRQIETLRRLKYRPGGGFAYALLADAHPSVSWSLLDDRRVAKPAYHALVEACRPLLVVADRLPAAVRPNDPLALDVHLVSDLRIPLEHVRVSATLSWTGGDHSWAWEGDVPADSCRRIGTISVVVPEAYGPMRLDLAVVAADHVASNRYDTVIRP